MAGIDPVQSLSPSGCCGIEAANAVAEAANNYTMSPLECCDTEVQTLIANVAPV